MVLLRGSWVTEFPTLTLNFKADGTYLPETANLKRIDTSDMRDQIVGNDSRVFATNRLLSRLLCAIIYIDDKVSEARRICSSALSRFGFGRLEGLISSSSPFLPVQASIVAQHHLGNACRVMPEIHQGDHELSFHQ